MPSNNEDNNLPKSWPASLTVSAVGDCIRRYGDGGAFLKRFNPDIQAECKKYESRTFVGKAPKLETVAKAYGEQVARTFLVIQIADLAEFTGCKESLPLESLPEVAGVILANYGGMKVTEFAYFCNRFKSGMYGDCYGRLNALRITSALSVFEKEAQQQRQKYRDEEDAKYERWEKMEEEKRGINRIEFEKLKEAHIKAGDYEEWEASLTKTDYKAIYQQSKKQNEKWKTN